MTAEQLKDKKFVALYLSERWGTVERFKIQRHKAAGNWLFVKCQEKYFYDEDDYIGNNPTHVYAIPLHNGTVSAEIFFEEEGRQAGQQVRRPGRYMYVATIFATINCRGI